MAHKSSDPFGIDALKPEGLESLRQDLGRLFDLPAAFIAKLAQLARTDRGVHILEERREEAQTLLAEFDADRQVANDALSAAQWLSDKAAEADLSEEEIVAALSKAAERFGLAGFDDRKEALAALVLPTEAYRVRAKLAEYENGWQPYIKAFASNIEIRAAIGTRAQDAKAYIPWANVRLKIGYADGSDGDSFAQIGLSVSDLDWLMARLENLRSRMKIVSKELESKLPNVIEL